MIEQPRRKKLVNVSDDARYYWQKIQQDREKDLETLNKQFAEPSMVKKPVAPVEKPKEVDPDNEPYNPESYEMRSDIKEIIAKKDSQKPK